MEKTRSVTTAAAFAAVAVGALAAPALAASSQAHFIYRNSTNVAVYISVDGRQVLTVTGGQTQDLYVDGQSRHNMTYSSAGGSVTLVYTPDQSAPEQKCTLDTRGVRCGPDFPPPR